MERIEEAKNRTISRLALIGRWLSLFEHHYKHKHTDQELGAINHRLGKYDDQQLEQAFSYVFEHSKYYPRLADIIERIPDPEAGDMPPWEYPEKYPPFPHRCHVMIGKLPRSGSLRMLENINRYEACHIFCPGTFRLRCPNCGCDAGSYRNPFFELLMTLDLAGTRGWNPEHKGHMLCDPCAKKLGDEWTMKSSGWARGAP
jgi:hypothetical protein